MSAVWGGSSSRARLYGTQQLLQLAVLPCTQQLYGIGTVVLERIENVRSAFWAVAAVAIVEGVAVVVKRNNPSIGFNGHHAAVHFSPRLLT